MGGPCSSGFAALSPPPLQQPLWVLVPPCSCPQVNDLALAGDVLVSCSSDRTLRVWQPDSPGKQPRSSTPASIWVGGLNPATPGGERRLAAQSRVRLPALRCFFASLAARPVPRPHRLPTPPPAVLVGGAEPALGCLTGHSDYVTSLAASSDGARLASGGLRGEVLLWDLARLQAVMAGAAQAGSRRPLRSVSHLGMLPCWPGPAHARRAALANAPATLCGCSTVCLLSGRASCGAPRLIVPYTPACSTQIHSVARAHTLRRSSPTAPPQQRPPETRSMPWP